MIRGIRVEYSKELSNGETYRREFIIDRFNYVNQTMEGLIKEELIKFSKVLEKLEEGTDND